MPHSPLLTIDVAGVGSSQLVLKLDPDSSPHCWELVYAQWGDRDQNSQLRFRRLMLETEKLVNEFDWFRRNWIGQIGQLEITSAAKQVILSFRETKNLFLQLIESGPVEYSGEIVSPNSRPLTDFQVNNVNKLLGMPNGANFSVPGAGKTATTLATYSTLKFLGEMSRMLVICPKSAFESWSEESQLFGIPQDKFMVFEGRPIPRQAELVVTNYEQLQNQKTLELLVHWLKLDKSNLVFDEAHRVKGGPGKTRWEACRKLSSFAKRVDILTGTPMPQGFADVRNIFRLAYPKLTSSDLSDKQIEKMGPGTCFVRTTKDQLGLPPVSTNLISQEMTEVHSEIYKALKNQYSGLIRLKPRNARELAIQGKAIMTLLAVASNPGLLSAKYGAKNLLNFRWPLTGYSPQEDLMQLIENYPSTELPWKFIWTRAYAEKMASQGKKIIVWTNFVGNIKALLEVLAPLNPVAVYGIHQNAERESNLRTFRTDSSCSVLITNPMTLGEGISLHTVCHDSVYLDRSFNAGIYLQSLDRIHRLGLENGQETNITLLSSIQTIDVNVEERLSFKVDQMAQLLNDPFLKNSAKSTPYDFLEDRLDISELLDLDQGDLHSLFSHFE
jgi:SNF2 family DNA or RNA helicase